MKKVITIWHNVEMHYGRPVGMLNGYTPGHAMTPVFVYVSESPEPENEAYELFNAPEEYLVPKLRPIQRRYYANKLRSLSVGDVVQVDDDYWAVARYGFDSLGHGLSARPFIQANPFDNFTDDES
jgi:hypothetical protein